MSSTPNVFARALVALPLTLALAVALPAQTKTAAPGRVLAAEVPVDKTAWLYKGSDITPDPDWRFGTLPNGLRYAVRKNGVPPGQVSIRVRIDAGSLMEREGEQGYAHLIEHLSFRGSEHVPDGEAKRIWQRMGVTFGADTNASTSFTQTVYKLDLPMANETSLAESLKILEGMMSGPGLTQAALNAERPVVMAEAREQPGPQVRLGDLTRATLFAGQPLSNRSPIGTPETLSAATAASVAAFHSRWYRPERAVVVISGDMDPAVFERQIVRAFADWKGVGAPEPTPNFGSPQPGKTATAALVEPALPPIVTLAYLRPWTVGDDTVIFNQKRMIDSIAVRIVNRRLERRARAGGSFISASADLEDVSRSANGTFVSILPIGDDWEAALKDVRVTIADAIAVPPTQAEIDRELAEIGTSMKASVDTARVDAGAKKADDLVEAVDIKETTTTPATSLGIFQGAIDKRMFTPAAVQASAKAVFTGVALRGVVNTRVAGANVPALLATALDTPVASTATAGKALRSVTFDALPKLGTPGKVTARSVVVADPKFEKIEFANGVRMLLFENPSEVSRVYVRVRFGRGLQALPTDRLTPAYAGDLALMASGIGTLGQEELDQLTGNRRIGLDFKVDSDAFVMGATTSAADLPDQLRLIAAKLTNPGWDPQPVARAKAVMLASYAGLESSPDGVLSRELDRLVHDGDPRWGTPSRADIEKLDAKSFRALWEPLLASGPIEVQVFGDVKADAAIDAVARSFGAMKPRKAAAPRSPSARFPAHVAQPVVRTHKGNPTQAAAVLAWPTGGGSADIAEGRKLEVLAAVFRDRLLDKLRSEAGVSYTPNVASAWPVGMPMGGRMMAIGMVPPDKTGFFFDLARGIAADLVAKPIDTDELRRSLVPVVQQVARLSTGNMFWLAQAEGGTYDPKRLAAIDTIATDLTSITPEQVQALAAKYLQPAKDWSMVVVPEKAVSVAPSAAR
ncbi:insulinase family protein [Sphingomonas donggukensis]|uniref:Insulinase family protein n=1 Tax=Sphingomonas donggukensis TaxID=2949093 RepID=A0ABY4TTV9_9SPHN|nr:M16 family metallopeptidase [Sphingomonas donggukensis]URW75151.1 insulinase family protein [Sphingomonas donggukensis]